MTDNELNILLRAHIRFLKKHDALNKYLYEYKLNPNEFNSGNILVDLKHAISAAWDHTGFHMRAKGFNRVDSAFGATFWSQINNDFVKEYFHNKPNEEF